MSRVLLFLLPISVIPLHAVSTVSVYSGRNGGEHIFETGTKYPNLSGIRGGSRLTYHREYDYYGIGGSASRGRWNLKGYFNGTPGYVETGGGRDEDFFLNSASTEKGTKIATRELSYNDSAHIFTGTRNFADGKTDSNMKENRFGAELEYYLAGSADSWKTGSFVFIGSGFRYGFSKYYLENVRQFVDTTPPVYFYIHRGLSYSIVNIEIPASLGIGKRFTGGWSVYTTFEVMYAYSRSRDFHMLRALNFIAEADGAGLNWKTGAGKVFGDYNLVLQLSEHRLFLAGTVLTRGGLSPGDILSNHTGRFPAYVNTKEYSVELALSKKI